MGWDAFQHEALVALGHTVYVPAPLAPLPADRLLHALLRAAGRSADATDARLLANDWPATATLRGDPAAKRALWPALRSLRSARQ